jgi:rhodanese-related sulfurtransferase
MTDYFARRLAHETDVADVAQALGDGTFTVVDTRSEAAYAAGHVPGAIRITDELPDGPLVVYCWGPGCNGATKAAARLSAEGREVKEMLGGFEYWQREGHHVERLPGWTSPSERCAASATPMAPAT